jgi:hypothetical protein
MAEDWRGSLAWESLSHREISSEMQPSEDISAFRRYILPVVGDVARLKKTHSGTLFEWMKHHSHYK